MGRGSSGQRQLAEKQLDMENQMIQQQRADQQAAEQRLLPAVEDIGKSSYDLGAPMSDAEKSSILNPALASSEGAYEAAGTQMRTSAAKTRNSAGLLANLGELARQRARD